MRRPAGSRGGDVHRGVQAEFTPGNVQTPERSKQVFRVKVTLREGSTGCGRACPLTSGSSREVRTREPASHRCAGADAAYRRSDGPSRMSPSRSSGRRFRPPRAQRQRQVDDHLLCGSVAATRARPRSSASTLPVRTEDRTDQAPDRLHVAKIQLYPDLSVRENLEFTSGSTGFAGDRGWKREERRPATFSN